MDWRATTYSLPLLVAAAVSAILAIYAWRQRRTTGASAFMVLMLGVAEWALTYDLELQSVTLTAKIFWDRWQFLGIVTCPRLGWP